MIPAPAQAAQEQARQADGKFGPQVFTENPTVALSGDPATKPCPTCGTDDGDFNESSGLCPDCHADAHCRKCGEEYNGDGDGYDGMCPKCADEADPADDDDDDTVCVFDHGDHEVSIDHRGGENYSLYDQNSNEHLGDFQYAGDPDDHSELEDEAVRALKELKPDMIDPEDQELDLSLFNEEGKVFALSLYHEGAGLKGTLEPYNGDIPLQDGALRYWNEELDGEISIGRGLDGIFRVDYEDEESVRHSVVLADGATPTDLHAAILDVERRALEESNDN